MPQGVHLISLIYQKFPKPSLLECVWGIFVILASFSNYFVGQLTLGESMPRSVILYGLLTPFALAFFKSQTQSSPSSLKVLALVIACLFSQFVTIGRSFFLKQDWSLCFGNWQSTLIWGIHTLCFSYVFYKIVIGILSILQNQTFIESDYRINAKRWLFIIVAVKLIYFAALYPCVFDIDAAIGLRTFLDPNSAICNHHPFLIQTLHGSLFELGQYWGHTSLGFACFSLILIIISSGILVYGLKLLAQAKIGKTGIIVAAIFFAFFPLYPYLNLFITKDGLFAYSFLLYVFTIYELYLSKGDSILKVRFIALHVASVLLLCLTRHQGIYLVVFEFLLLLFCYKKYWKRISTITLPTLIIYFLYSNILLPYLNVEAGGKQEIYSTLFHQTSHYLHNYPLEVSASEQNAIYTILDKDKLSHNYRYNLTDGSKDCYKYNPMVVVSLYEPVVFRHIDHSKEDEELKAYRSAWLSMLFRHPLAYLQATLGVIIGFFYNNNEPLVKLEPHWVIAPFAITPEYIFWHNDRFEKAYYNHAFQWTKRPIINWIFAIPYYLWLTIIALGLLFYRRNLRGISVFFPVFLSLGLLLLCPYSSGRYAFPIVVTLPLLIIYLISSNNKVSCPK